MNEAVIATDMDLSMTAWNWVAERLYGWPTEQARGPDTPRRASVVQNILRDGTPQLQLQAGTMRES
jgi:PAS domain-containing protein